MVDRASGIIDGGIVVIDKPIDITSAKVVARLKKILGARKAGHTGTLDPFATGVMVCCINDATRLAGFFLHGEKTYEAVMELGVDTDTQDFTGAIISTHRGALPAEDAIRSAFERFEGAIEQDPPVYSALKHKGVPLYKLARKGKPVRKPARRVTIHYIRIREIRPPEVCFEVRCSAGTYIRALCTDIGKVLGCGGILKKLRRIESSGFSIEEASTLTEIEELVKAGKARERIIGMSDALPNMPAHIADDSLAERIMHGNTITARDIPHDEGRIYDQMKILNRDGRLIAVMRHEKESGAYNYCCVFNK